MADNNGSGTGQWGNPISNDGTPNDQSASFIPPSDNQIPYTVNAMGKPSITNPGGHGMPGHQQTYDNTAMRAQAAAYGNAAAAAAQAKANAQQARDANVFRPRFTSAPKKGK